MIEEEGEEMFLNADRYLHTSAAMKGGKKGKKGPAPKKAKKGPGLVIRAAVRPAKKKKQ